MIGELAFSWGFSDHSHFTRRFRRVRHDAGRVPPAAAGAVRPLRGAAFCPTLRGREVACLTLP